MLEIFEVTFEVYIEDKLVNKQIMQAPKEILMANYLQTIEQIGNDQRPMKIRMYRPDVIWDNFEQRQKTISYECSFSNNAMLAWEENKQKGDV